MTVSTQSIDQYLKSIGAELSDRSMEALRHLSRQTALRLEPGHGYFVSNFWRGPLLYSLVQAHRPKAILELGTGRGYGALSMSMAASDLGLSTRIWTVDSIPPDTRIGWHHYAGNGPITETLSLSEFWDREIPPELSRHVTTLTGETSTVARSWTELQLPPVDMVFIDAEHSYIGVKRDLLASLQACKPDAEFVFDDYGVREGYGVKRLVDDYIPSHSPDSGISIIELANETQYDVDNDHRMVVWTPNGTATPANFASFFNYEHHWTSFVAGAHRMAIRLRAILPGFGDRS